MVFRSIIVGYFLTINILCSAKNSEDHLIKSETNDFDYISNLLLNMEELPKGLEEEKNISLVNIIKDSHDRFGNNYNVIVKGLTTYHTYKCDLSIKKSTEENQVTGTSCQLNFETNMTRSDEHTDGDGAIPFTEKDIPIIERLNNLISDHVGQVERAVDHLTVVKFIRASKQDLGDYHMKLKVLLAPTDCVRSKEAKPFNCIPLPDDRQICDVQIIMKKVTEKMKLKTVHCVPEKEASVQQGTGGNLNFINLFRPKQAAETKRLEGYMRRAMTNVRTREYFCPFMTTIKIYNYIIKPCPEGIRYDVKYYGYNIRSGITCECTVVFYISPSWRDPIVKESVCKKNKLDKSY